MIIIYTPLCCRLALPKLITKMLFFAQNLFPSAEFSLQIKLKGIDVISYERKFVADFYIEDCKVCDNVNGS